MVKSMLADIEYTTARLVTSLYYMTINILASKTEFLPCLLGHMSSRYSLQIINIYKALLNDPTESGK